MKLLFKKVFKDLANSWRKNSRGQGKFKKTDMKHHVFKRNSTWPIERSRGQKFKMIEIKST